MHFRNMHSKRISKNKKQCKNDFTPQNLELIQKKIKQHFSQYNDIGPLNNIKSDEYICMQFLYPKVDPCDLYNSIQYDTEFYYNNSTNYSWIYQESVQFCSIYPDFSKFKLYNMKTDDIEQFDNDGCMQNIIEKVTQELSILTLIELTCNCCGCTYNLDMDKINALFNEDETDEIYLKVEDFVHIWNSLF